MRNVLAKKSSSARVIARSWHTRGSSTAWPLLRRLHLSYFLPYLHLLRRLKMPRPISIILRGCLLQNDPEACSCTYSC